MVAILETVCIVPHELAHVIGAWLMRMRVLRVELGAGPRLADFEIGDVQITLRMAPTVGLVSAVPTSPSWPRLRFAVMVVLGPLTNIAMLLVALHFKGDSRLFGEAWTKGPAPWHALAIANIVALVAVTIGKVHTMGASHASLSDIQLLLALLFEGPAQTRNLLTSRLVGEAQHLMRRGRGDRAIKLLEQAEREFPAELRPSSQFALVLLLQGRYAEGAAVLEQVVESSSLTTPERGMALNNLAIAHLMTATPAALERADRFSAMAYELLPGSAAARSTRGGTLIELGQVDQGLALLRSAMDAADRDDNKAHCACFIAIGEHRRGNTALAAQMLETARRLDPTCDALPRAEAVCRAMNR